MIDKIFLITIFITITFLNSFPQKNNNYVIDFGKEIIDHNYLLNKEEVLAKKTFLRLDLERSRHSYLLYGITDENIFVNLKFSKVKYKIIAYVEAGLTDSTYLQLFADENPVYIDWQSFSPPAEGRENIQKMYRSINLDIPQNKDSLKLNFIADKDSVRLLAVALFPVTEDFEQIPEEIENKLIQFGKIDSKVSSDEIRNLKHNKILIRDNSFTQYLQLRLDEFALAIDLFEMIGWEKGNEIYGLGIFDRLNQAVMIMDGIIGDPWTEKYFGERARLIRGKILWWLNKERGGKGELAGAIKDLKYLNRIYPDLEIIRMYLGEKIDTPDQYDSLSFHPNAPEWSKLQYEALSRLSSEIAWWVNERQADNGELGGKIGDDVELLRWWSALAAFGDTNTIKGWNKLGKAVWENPKVYKGYSKKPIDVEHSSEFISDTFPDMIYFNSSNADKYLKPSAEYFKSLWTFKNKFGRRFFRSAWFSSTEFKTNPPRDRDLALNSRATKAVRFLAWKNNDAELFKVLHEWSTSWKDMALRDDKGKPIGIFPASVTGVDEQFNGDGENWYEAEMFWDYFNWESGNCVQFYDQLLFSYITNEDESLLEPLKLTLELIKQYGNGSLTSNYNKGTKEWAATEIADNYRFWNTVQSYRKFTEDQSYDSLIVEYGNPYSKYLITKDEKHLLFGLNKLLEDIRYNLPLRTTEVIHTDRVRTRDIITLKGMITGDDAYEADSPFLDVTYANTSSDLTMLVTEKSLQNLQIKFYSHSPVTVYPIVKVWLLEKGTYNLKVMDKSNIILSNVNIEIEKKGQEIQLEIPSNKEIVLNLTKIK